MGTSNSAAISFGGLALREQKIQTFTIRNLSMSNLKFQWPDHGNIVIEPKVGHLPANSSKDISVILSSSESKTLNWEEISVDLSPGMELGRFLGPERIFYF